ncbi:E3 ubiquitin-protein ligase Mdm2 isoform X2 [Esox lucius]|nr:E3 ubiquitin-protein ligase Mdm2 isoform X2 [Esox lucius]XP_010881001.2 E3 ubiquitin-protein ligase Mdm2 isoform X2 [Esox lucius]XP_010881002.2 E3 ubiquitin-protein ligase Mdm2 isoform X2 [Esox lucius]
MAENCLSSSHINTVDNEKLVRPNDKLHTLLQEAGVEKEILTMKEVIFYLGQYIMKKQLYDKKQQHIVHCAHDALGAVLGVDSFSVKEPQVLFAMITQNLTAVKNPESQSGFTEPRSQIETDRGPEETDSDSRSSSTSERRRRRIRSSITEDTSTQDEDECEPRKRTKSDSFSLTFDESMSWCVIGGLRPERGSSESSDSHSNTEVGSLVSDACEDGLIQDMDSDCDNFSVEFEVESIDSDTYSDNEEASVSGEDEVYEVTIFEAEEEDSFDEDTEITEADYWKCSKCEELNPPLPRNCNRCWTLRTDWFPDNDTSNAASTIAPNLKPLPPKPCPSPAPIETDEAEGLDVPDGKRARSPLSLLKDSQDSPSVTGPDSQDSACSSQPSTSSSGSSGISSGTCSAPSGHEERAPDLERFNSLEAHLPISCLDPCVICQTRPKNGCIVHGRTGHLMACYTCAKKLKKRNKLCPVCREPIQSVVLMYFS